MKLLTLSFAVSDSDVECIRGDAEVSDEGILEHLSHCWDTIGLEFLGMEFSSLEEGE